MTKDEITAMIISNVTNVGYVRLYDHYGAHDIYQKRTFHPSIIINHPSWIRRMNNTALYSPYRIQDAFKISHDIVGEYEKKFKELYATTNSPNIIQKLEIFKLLFKHIYPDEGDFQEYTKKINEEVREYVQRELKECFNASYIYDCIKSPKGIRNNYSEWSSNKLCYDKLECIYNNTVVSFDNNEYIKTNCLFNNNYMLYDNKLMYIRYLPLDNLNLYKRLDALNRISPSEDYVREMNKLHVVKFVRFDRNNKKRKLRQIIGNFIKALQAENYTVEFKDFDYELEKDVFVQTPKVQFKTPQKMHNYIMQQCSNVLSLQLEPSVPGIGSETMTMHFDEMTWGNIPATGIGIDIRPQNHLEEIDNRLISVPRPSGLFHEL